jgi:hypothetical protein
MDWLHALTGGVGASALAGYFGHPLAFPTLALPAWAAESAMPLEVDLPVDLAVSSIHGYLFIRMIDNVMDGDSDADPRLLPALAYFHTEFVRVYQRMFPYDHPFWPRFDALWYGTAAAAIQDAQPKTRITLAIFETIAAHKVRAALIPLIALSYQQMAQDRIDAWSELIHRLGMWHQMQNDVFDWHKDSQHHNRTYFLDLAESHREPTESPTEWIVRAGFQEGCETLREWMEGIHGQAESLACPGLGAYLLDREAQFERRVAAAQAGFDALNTLAGALR